ncbi:MAG: STAS domain-containing protein [Pseudomonadales bacterium]
MKSGEIQVAERHGSHLIKLTGDVRVTLCGSFDQYIDTILARDGFVSVIIDLREAEGLDSTTLGLLAKISIQARHLFKVTPVIVSNNESINRLLISMGFNQVFDIREQAPVDDIELGQLPHVACSEEGMRDKVLDAHRVLMGLCDENRARFEGLVSALEKTP